MHSTLHVSPSVNRSQIVVNSIVIERSAKELEGKLAFDNLLKDEYLQSYQTHVQSLAKIVKNTRFYNIM
jgi:hypothetical protein